MANPGRNEQCPCGSGRKFKRCCGSNDRSLHSNQTAIAHAAILKAPRGDPTQLTKSGVRQLTVEAQRLCQTGNTLASLGHIVQAIAHYQQALSLQPDNPLAYFCLGNIYARQGDSNRAVDCYKRALTLQSDYPEVHCNLANVLVAKREIADAIAHYRRALSLRPNYPAAHCNLANVFVLDGQPEKAIPHYKLALSTRSDYPEAHCNLANALALLGKTEEAVTHYDRALSLRSNYPEAYYNLGNVLDKRGQIGNAVVRYEQALSLREAYPEAHYNLGNALLKQGQIDRAMTHYQRALTLQPGFVDAHNNLCLAMNYAPNIEPARLFAAHVDFAKRFEEPLRASIEPHNNDRVCDRCLRIGYVSSDFREHPVSHFIEAVLRNHAREKFVVFCYANQQLEDAVTERLRSHTDHWRCVFNVSDEQVTQQIRTDKIDILIDLNGHTGGNRLLVFARKPAPIQVTWIGYPNTTGLSTIDYRITDGVSDPKELTEHFHTEELIHLPRCFSCYLPPANAPGVSTLRAKEQGTITFGSFNNLAKITQNVMDVWASVLRAIPNSRLILKNHGLSDDQTRIAVKEAFDKLGVPSKRLVLFGHDQSKRTHLEQYWEIDIGLDTFPYNGTTTTCEALWMGVPVITLAGKTHAGRVGLSLLSNLGLPELVANTVEQYISIAQRLAANLEYLRVLRSELRPRLAASPLMDAKQFTVALEQTYLKMWENWCIKMSP